MDGEPELFERPYAAHVAEWELQEPNGKPPCR